MVSALPSLTPSPSESSQATNQQSAFNVKLASSGELDTTPNEVSQTPQGTMSKALSYLIPSWLRSSSRSSLHDKDGVNVEDDVISVYSQMSSSSMPLPLNRTTDKLESLSPLFETTVHKSNILTSDRLEKKSVLESKLSTSPIPFRDAPDDSLIDVYNSYDIPPVRLSTETKTTANANITPISTPTRNSSSILSPTPTSGPDGTLVFAGPILSVTAYKDKTPLSRLLQSRENKLGMKTRKELVKVTMTDTYITESVLNADGTSGAVLASMRTPLVGFALLRATLDGRCRFVLKDESMEKMHRNQSGGSPLKKKKVGYRVYEAKYLDSVKVRSQVELNVWRSHLSKAQRLASSVSSSTSTTVPHPHSSTASLHRLSISASFSSSLLHLATESMHSIPNVDSNITSRIADLRRSSWGDAESLLSQQQPRGGSQHLQHRDSVVFSRSVNGSMGRLDGRDSVEFEEKRVMARWNVDSGDRSSLRSDDSLSSPCYSEKDLGDDNEDALETKRDQEVFKVGLGGMSNSGEYLDELSDFIDSQVAPAHDEFSHRSEERADSIVVQPNTQSPGRQYADELSEFFGPRTTKPKLTNQHQSTLKPSPKSGEYIDEVSDLLITHLTSSDEVTFDKEDGKDDNHERTGMKSFESREYFEEVSDLLLTHVSNRENDMSDIDDTRDQDTPSVAEILPRANWSKLTNVQALTSTPINLSTNFNSNSNILEALRFLAQLQKQSQDLRSCLDAILMHDAKGLRAIGAISTDSVKLRERLLVDAGKIIA
ncbi:hypothetical protein HDV05_003265 [Chytridiales sp. JEL 0842]|nr:hypothetical protein HDV05_003265 [Chytridiales sp. JEL 0842]